MRYDHARVRLGSSRWLDLKNPHPVLIYEWRLPVYPVSSSAARVSTDAGKPASAATFNPCDRPARPGLIL